MPVNRRRSAIFLLPNSPNSLYSVVNDGVLIIVSSKLNIRSMKSAPFLSILHFSI
jgi:hypothetical protein